MHSMFLLALVQASSVVVRKHGEVVALPSLEELNAKGAALANQISTDTQEAMPTKEELEQYAADAQAAMSQAAADLKDAVPKDKEEAQKQVEALKAQLADLSAAAQA